MAGYYNIYKVFTPGEILTASDLNASEQQHITFNTALASEGFSASLDQSRVQIGSGTLALTMADELARIREKLRLLGNVQYWDQVNGPTQSPVMPKAQIILPLEGALLPDGTAGNGFPTVIERTSAQVSKNPKPVEIVYDFAADVPQYLMWKIVSPLGYTEGGVIELVLRFSMADNVTAGNFKPVGGIAPIRSGIDNVGFAEYNAPTMSGSDAAVPPVWGQQRVFRVLLPTTNVTANRKCIVIVGVHPADVGNASGRRRLESASIEFTRGEFLSPDPGMPNPMTDLGDLITGFNSGTPIRLPIGLVDQVLTVEAGVPKWKDQTGGFTNPMTAFGDLIQGGTSGVPSRLPIGATGHVLSVVAGSPSWQPPPSGMQDPMSAEGDLITRSSGVPVPIPIGLSGQVLTVVGGYPGWTSITPITTRGDLIVGNVAGEPSRLAAGLVGHVLTTLPTGDLGWADANPMTTLGDMIVAASGGAAQRLPVGTDGQVLSVVSGLVQWNTTPNPLAALGDLIVGGVSGVQNRLPIGGNGQLLTVVAGSPVWQNSTALSNPMTTQGDMIVGVVGGTPSRLAAGTNAQVLTTLGGIPTWQTPPFTGSVITTRGDLIVGNVTGIAVRFPRGTTDQILSVESDGDLVWKAETGFSNPMTTAGDLILAGASGTPTRLPKGSDTQVLTVVAGALAWQAPASGGMANPMTTLGDLIAGGASGVANRLAVGSANQVLTVVGGVPTWQAPVSGGMTNPMTTPGDLIAGSTAGSPVRLAIGSNGQFLGVTGGALTWSAAPGFANPMTTAGDIIVGAASGVPARLAASTNGFVLTLAAGTPTWAANAAMANPMTTAGDLVRGGTSGTPTRIAVGTDTHVLTVVAGIPSWSAALGFANPMTSPGDLIRGGASGVATRFAIGSNGQVLGVSGGALTWVAQTGFANPMVSAGDLILGGASGAPGRLAIGAENQVLTVVGGAVTWSASSMANPMTAIGDLIRGGASGTPTRLAVGTNGHFLTLTAGIPTWSALPVDPGFANPMTGVGDLIRGGTSGAPTRLAPGTNGHFLTLTAGVPAWAAAPGFTNPMTTAGDLIVGGASGAPGRLADVAAGAVLASGGVGVAPAWTTTPVVTFLQAVSVHAISHLKWDEQASAPATPAGGEAILYTRTSGVTYRKHADGIESPFQVLHGSVRLVRTSGTVLTLAPYNGGGLWVFNVSTGNWRFRTIPGAGLTLTSTSCRINNVAAQPTVANTTYLVTVGDVAGTLTLQLWTTLTHAPDATTGVEIMAGSPFQTVVGLVRASASASFQDNTAGRMIASWFNRRIRSLTGSFTANRATSSTTQVELHTEIRTEFVTWGDEAVELQFMGAVANGTANTLSVTEAALDGIGVAGSITTSAANISDLAVHLSINIPTEGYHYGTVLGNVAAGTSTWASGGRLTGSVMQ